MIRSNWIAWCLKQQHIVAIPTDTIYGFSCLPTLENQHKLAQLKQRDISKGFILLTSELLLLQEYIDDAYIAALEDKYNTINTPTTFIVPSTHLLATNNTIAVRYTKDTTISEICSKVGSVIISTSCNISSRQNIKTLLKLRVFFNTSVAFYMRPKHNTKASTIIDLTTNTIIRQ